MAIRAWLMDFDGTLYSATPVKLAMALELVLLGPHRVRAVSAFRSMHEQVRDHPGLVEGVSSFELQLQLASDKLGTSVEQLRPIVDEWLVRRPGKWLAPFHRRGLVGELKEFRRQGGKSALVSDYPARNKLEAMGMGPLFDCIVANGELGGPARMKPDPTGYLSAARELDVDPKDCLVIGDRDDADGEAARRAGMHFRLV